MAITRHSLSRDPIFARILLVVAVASVFAAPAIQAAEALRLSDAWVRAMPPGQRMTAGYLSISNPGELPVTLQSVSSDAGMASLHETRVEEGRSSMRAVHSLTIAPGETVELAPGGMHIMFMGLESVPAQGETLGVCLQTSVGEQCLDMPVQRSAEDHADHSQHQH
jgi:copper(I)-binding protein